MVFEYIKERPVWCIHFEDMKLYKGILLGEESGRDEGWMYIRMEGAAINKIEYVNPKNVFDNEESANRALFKASLKEDQRESK